MDIERETQRDNQRSTLVELQIAGVSLHPETQEPRIILRNLLQGAYLTLHVGPYEAGAILAEIHGTGEREPFAYDAFVELLRVQELYALCVEIDADSHTRSHLLYTDGESHRSVDMRAGDGIALAIRLEVPIYARTAEPRRERHTPQTYRTSASPTSVPAHQDTSGV